MYWLFPYRAPWASGRSSEARSSGTSSRCRPTRRFSLLFWFVGLIPDLATLRDRATNRFAKIAYGMWPWLAGLARHWHNYESPI